MNKDDVVLNIDFDCRMITKQVNSGRRRGFVFVELKPVDESLASVILLYSKNWHIGPFEVGGSVC